MLERTEEKMTAERFQDIFTDEQLRNRVAYAHWRCDAKGNRKEQITCSFPKTYIVTPEQIEAAKAEIQRAKKARLTSLGNKLVLVGMGMTYDPRYEDDVCNHRIRTEFQNAQGRRFFIEVGTAGAENMRIDHAIDRTREKELKGKHDRQAEYYNYKGLESQTRTIKYTLQNVLRLVNEYFDCNFSEIEIDNHTLRTEEFVCISPLKEV